MTCSVVRRWLLHCKARRYMYSRVYCILVVIATVASLTFISSIWTLPEMPVSQPVDNTEELQWAGKSYLHRMLESQGVLTELEGRAFNQAKRRKFIFVLKHYEQLGMSANNMLALLSAAKHRERQVVTPFVNNSRFSGLPHGSGHRTLSDPADKFAPFNFYFDLPQVNRKLISNGYSTFAAFGDFLEHCAHRLNVVVHFLYDDKSTAKKSLQWFDLTKEELAEVHEQARRNSGWTFCPFIKRIRIGRRLQMKVSRYVCVDPEIITSLEALERRVLNGSFCVGIINWKGNGTGRTHFPLHGGIYNKLRPSDLKHNPLLVQIAEQFIEKYLRGPYIAVHVRAEKHLLFKGLDTCLTCIKKLAKMVNEWQGRFSFLEDIFIATDLVDYGSDSLIQEASPSDRRLARNYLARSVGTSVSLSQPEGLYDRGALAIIEMHILAAGKLLFTVGDGYFQEWVMDLFLQKNKNAKKIHRVCVSR